QRRDGVLLAGRCYERESVPYKALDSLVDALARYLVRLPTAKVEPLLPRDVLPLARIFPVLRRVEAIAGAPRKAAELPDPQEQRRRAFLGLRELFGRIADRGPLVLFIDDLQWGDKDSAALLAELLRPPDPPSLLLVACYRSEDAEASRPLRELLVPRSTLPGAPRVAELVLEPLSPEETRALATGLFGDLGATAPQKVEELARESGGNPFFVDELVRYVQAGGWTAAQGPAEGQVSLDAVVRSRTQRLPDPARRLLHVVAVAGRPISHAVAARAAELGSEEIAALAPLRGGNLVRSAATGEADALETYHDRIRETVVANLSPERLAEVHLRVGRALEASGQADPEALALHFGAAGQTERAARYAAAAAGRAAEALAFDRAAALYRRALELEPNREHEVLLGDALANAGRGIEAATTYLEAAGRERRPPLPAAVRLDLERRAAEQLLRSGHIDEGLEVVRSVLGAVNMRLAPTPRRAWAALLARRAHLALRGLGFRERDASQLSAEQVTRIDVCWSVAAGLSMVDTIRGASFQTRHLLLALEAGEPYRVARAIAAEAAFVATGGRKARPRALKLMKIASELATRVGDPRALGLVSFCAGLTEFLVGNWRAAQNHAEAAEQIFFEAGSGLTWEAANTRLFSVWSLFYLGEVGELARRTPLLLDEARERGDLYAVTSLRSGLANVGLLAADAPVRARAEVNDAMTQWSHQGFHFQHYWGLLSHGMIDLYSGEGASTWKRVNETWPALAGSLLLRIQAVRIEATYLRGRSALAASKGSPDEKALLAFALRDAKALSGEGLPHAGAFAALLRGGVCASSSDAPGALLAYTFAADTFERAQMALFAAAARRQAGRLRGGEEGSAEVNASEAAMAAQRIVRPDRMVAMLAPCPALDG
ncbi:MAG: ATP-binding protein, partial [Myxococcaceae bacterium]